MRRIFTKKEIGKVSLLGIPHQNSKNLKNI